jgi:hypothetical protein
VKPIIRTGCVDGFRKGSTHPTALTWFEYAPGNAPMFEDLVGALRATEEWTHVEREIDVRLVRLD